MFELSVFIIPSFFTYLGYVHGQRKRQINVFSQWVFLPILFIYSYISFIIYFWGYDVLSDLQCTYSTIDQITNCINQLSFKQLLFVFLIAYCIGRALQWMKHVKHIKHVKWIQHPRIVKCLRIFDLFYQIEPMNETQNIIDKTLNKTPLIIFLDNGSVHIGVPASYDTRPNEVQCFDCRLMFSGYKKDGEISYHTNYLEVPETIRRVFYLKHIVSMGEFNYKTFLYFLDKKSFKNQTEQPISRYIKKLFQKIK